MTEPVLGVVAIQEVFSTESEEWVMDVLTCTPPSGSLRRERWSATLWACWRLDFNYCVKQFLTSAGADQNTYLNASTSAS